MFLGKCLASADLEKEAVEQIATELITNLESMVLNDK
jgi:hypothetical protein